MITGMLILWFFLTVLSLIFLVYDLYKNTPTIGIMKVAWILVVLYTGPIGLFLYLLSCREPMPGTHDKYISPMWKQALGSEVHCLAGDATGIILAAILLSFVTISIWAEVTIEYIAGFAFGLLVFQAYFMKNVMGGSYFKAVTSTFMPEWLSMNMIMSGMIPVMVIWTGFDEEAANPLTLSFWGKMSLATLVGGLFAYPINWWLVSRGLKHGMVSSGKSHDSNQDHSHNSKKPKPMEIALMTLISLVSLLIGCVIAVVGYSMAYSIPK